LKIIIELNYFIDEIQKISLANCSRSSLSLHSLSKYNDSHERSGWVELSLQKQTGGTFFEDVYECDIENRK